MANRRNRSTANGQGLPTLQRAIMDCLAIGRFYHPDGTAVIKCAGRIGANVTDTRQALKALAEQNRISFDENVIEITNPPARRRLITSEGFRQTRFATDPTGRWYPGTLRDDQVGILTVTIMTEEERRQMAPHLFNNTTDTTQEKDEPMEIDKIPTHEQLVRVLQFVIELANKNNNEPILREEVLQRIMDEFKVAEQSARDLLSVLEATLKVISRSLKYQGARYVLSVNEGLSIEDLDWHRKHYSGKVGSMLKTDPGKAYAIVVYALLWSSNKGQREVNMEHLCGLTLGIKEPAAKRVLHALEQSGVLITDFSDWKSVTIAFDEEKLGDPETLYQRIRALEKSSTDLEALPPVPLAVPAPIPTVPIPYTTPQLPSIQFDDVSAAESSDFVVVPKTVMRELARRIRDLEEALSLSTSQKDELTEELKRLQALQARATVASVEEAMKLLED